MIGRSNLRVHGNAKIVLLDDGGVALIDALLHPFVERLADDRGDDIDDPLPGRLAQLFAVGHVPHDFLVPIQEAEDLIEAEVLVVWDADVNDMLHMNDYNVSAELNRTYTSLLR